MGRRWPWSLPGVLLAVLIVGGIAGSSTALAHARPRIRACGEVVTRVPRTGRLKVFSVSQVSARRLSCAGARSFVRTWERLGNHGKLPDGAGGKVKRGVIVYDRWGRPYRVSGFLCRSLAMMGPGPVLRERVTCGSPGGLVSWRESGRFG